MKSNKSNKKMKNICSSGSHGNEVRINNKLPNRGTTYAPVNDSCTCGGRINMRRNMKHIQLASININTERERMGFGDRGMTRR